MPHDTAADCPHTRAAPFAAAIGTLVALAMQPGARAQATQTLMSFTGYAHPDPLAVERAPDGTVASCRGSLVFYVHIATPGDLHVALERTAGAPATSLRVRVSAHPGPDNDARTVAAPAYSTDAQRVDLGTFVIAAPGYCRISLATDDGSALTNLHSLVLTGPAATNAQASTRERRNAASVHLGYPIDAAHEGDIEWFYCEAAPRTDPVWTFYMATGWQRGYFGMQVNSATERRLIFSVWDAGNERKDRARVGAADRVQLVAKGDGVVAEDFGNEGTGAHSHLVHDWKPGSTFRFLVHAARFGDDTTYTGWFWFAEKKQWGLVASFRAPKDTAGLRGLHSFNENFEGGNGDLKRECDFGNAWVRTRGGEWLPLLAATFTHDAHGGRLRFDRHALVRDGRFCLQNGGFEPPPEGAVARARDTLRVERPAGDHPADGELPTPPHANETR